ncbi:MAG: DUF2970 domain-containing protein [Terriglobales bacterium]
MIVAFKAVLWSFFGVRKRDEYRADIERLTPPQVIAAGVVCAAVLVLALLGIVTLVTR